MTAKIIQIAEALRDVLLVNQFPEAEVRLMPYMTREEAGDDRRVVIVPSGATYDEGSRRDFQTIYELRVVIEKAMIRGVGAGVSSSENAKQMMERGADLLTDLEALVGLWGDDGPLRFKRLAGADYFSGPSHPTGNIHEPQVLDEQHLFLTAIAIQYGAGC
jgi:hypothetical protein